MTTASRRRLDAGTLAPAGRGGPARRHGQPDAARRGGRGAGAGGRQFRQHQRAAPDVAAPGLYRCRSASVVHRGGPYRAAPPGRPDLRRMDRRAPPGPGRPLVGDRGRDWRRGASPRRSRTRCARCPAGPRSAAPSIFPSGLLLGSGFMATRRVIDISGDGANNDGRPVTEARDAAVAAGVTINGLPIIEVEPDLEAYYRENVIGGPDFFVIVVQRHQQFRRGGVAQAAGGGGRAFCPQTWPGSAVFGVLAARGSCATPHTSSACGVEPRSAG